MRIGSVVVYKGLLLALVSFYVFYALVGHILFFVGSKAWFVCTFAYFIDSLSQLGGASEYVTSFILQYVHLEPVGALLLSILSLAIYVVLTYLYRYLSQGSEDMLCLSLIPSAVLLSLSASSEYDVAFGIALLFSALVSYLYVEFRGCFKRAEKYVCLLTSALLFLFCGKWFVLFLAVICVYSSAKDRLIYLGFSAFLPLIYAYWQVLPVGECYMQFADKALLYAVLFSFFFVMIARCMPYQNIQKPLCRVVSIVSLFFLFSVASYSFVKQYNYKEKLMVLVEKHMNLSQWEELEKVARLYPSKNPLITYAFNLSLLKRDKLAEEILRYPQSFGINGLMIGSEVSQQKNDYLHHLYAHLGIYNEAHRLIWEGTTVSGYNRINLPYIVHYNAMMERPRIAAKFERLKNQTLRSDDFSINTDAARASRAIDVALSDSLPAKFVNIFNIGNDLNYLYTHAELSKPQADCLLLVLLLSNNVSGFAKYASLVKTYYPQKLPPIYDEALVLLEAMLPKEDFNALGICPSSEAKERYDSYVRVYKSSRGNARELMSFRSTYFYYIQFISPYGSEIRE